MVSDIAHPHPRSHRIVTLSFMWWRQMRQHLIFPDRPDYFCNISSLVRLRNSWYPVYMPEDSFFEYIVDGQILKLLIVVEISFSPRSPNYLISSAIRLCYVSTGWKTASWLWFGMLWGYKCTIEILYSIIFLPSYGYYTISGADGNKILFLYDFGEGDCV